MSFNWLERSRRAAGLATTVLAAWLLVGAGAAHAQEGAIAGTVTDAQSMEPIAGAQVFIPGTQMGALTNQQGQYRLEGVPAGQTEVEVRLIGYREASQTVTVQGGQVVTADFQLEQTALKLQDIVVTGVVGETPKVKLPFTVETLEAGNLPVPTSNVASLLAGKSPGVSVTQGSGQPGEAADIIMRGPKSIDAEGRGQGPLIVIDGVTQSRNASLADINSLDIASIEIVKGAAAASLYGARAQTGVIQITTKRGTSLQEDEFQVLVRGEYGMSQLAGSIGVADNHPYQMNASQTAFVTDQGNETSDFGQLGRAVGNPVLAGSNTFTTFQDQPFPGQLHDHVEEFFDPGETSSLYGALTGRFGDNSFRASFENFSETGVIECQECASVVRDEGYRRQNARINVDSRVGDFDISGSGFYSHSTQDDAAVSGGGDTFFALTFMSPAVDLTATDEDGLPRVDIDPLSQEENPLYQLAVRDYTDEVQRVMGSIDASWSPLDWFTMEANASYDRTDFDEVNLHPKNEKTHQGGGVVGFTGGELFERGFHETALNASTTAGFHRTFLDGDLTSRLKLRYLVEDQEFKSTEAEGSIFAVEGVPDFEAITGDKDADNEFTEIKSEGYFAILGLDYRGKYILDGLVRRDGSSLFGPDERWATYYRASAAYRPSQEPWWNLEPVDELKLRYSYGTAGGRPNFFARFETFSISSGQVFPATLGNTELKPEFTVEQEAGVNMVLFDRIGLDFTYVWATTDDQLLEVPQPSYVGFSSQWQNAGEVESNTIEASLNAAVLDRQDMGLNTRLMFSRTTQEITRLDIPAYTAEGRFFVAVGEELGAIWGDKFATSCTDVAAMGIDPGTCASQFDVNDDGYLVYVGEGNSFTDGVSKGLWGTTGDVAGATHNWGIPIAVSEQRRTCLRQRPESECPLSDFLPIGSTTPDFQASWQTTFRYKGFNFASLLDGVVGQDVYNQTRQWAWRDGALRGEEIDQSGKPEGTKKPLAYYSVLYSTNDTSSEFVEDGSFVKLRELSVGYTLPQSTVQGLFGGALDRVSINLIGRNLATITDYRGYDPEVGFGGSETEFGSAAIQREDAFDYPNFRSYSASLEVVF